MPALRRNSGHADIETTLGTYGHVIEGLGRSAADQVGEWFDSQVTANGVDFGGSSRTTTESRAIRERRQPAANKPQWT